MKRRGQKYPRGAPILAVALLALLGSVVFAQAASAKGGGLTPNTSGDTRAVFHTGNIQPDNIGHVAGACPGGAITIPGVTTDGTYLTIPPQPAGSSFVVYVKGGPQYNTYSYPPLDPTIAANLKNLHSPVNNGGNIAAISHWFICGSVTPPPPTKLNVYFGYADAGPSGHAAPAPPLLTNFSNIWEGGGASVNFVGGSQGLAGGCGLPRCGYDSGAVRIDNPTASPVSVSAVSVTIGGSTFQPWGTGSFTIPANGSLVLTQSTDWNFDTSDLNTCSGTTPVQSSLIPLLTITTPSVAGQTVNDTAQTLLLGGKDPLQCDPSLTVNESLPWVLAGNVTI